MEKIFQLLSSEGNLTVPKILVKEIGLEPAVVYGFLVSRYFYHKNREELKNGEWFYCTTDKMKEYTSLSHYKQTKAINKLKEINFIEVDTMGVPAKRYFKLRQSPVFKFLEIKDSSESKTRIQESSKLESEKLENYSSYKTKNKTINNTKHPPSPDRDSSPRDELSDPDSLAERGWN